MDHSVNASRTEKLNQMVESLNNGTSEQMLAILAECIENVKSDHPEFLLINEAFLHLLNNERPADASNLYDDTFASLCQHLKVPKIFAYDEKLATLSENDHQVAERFRLFAFNIWKIVLCVLSLMPDSIQFHKPTLVNLFTQCGAYLGDTAKRWTLSETREIVTRCSEVLMRKLNNSGKSELLSILKPYVQIIVKEKVWPLYESIQNAPKQIEQQQKLIPSQHLQSNTDEDDPSYIMKKEDQQESFQGVTTFENQKWKSEEVQTTAVFSWCVQVMQAPHLESILYLFVPPLITLLEDWEVRYKLVGIALVRHIIQNVSPTSLQQTGIGNLLEHNVFRYFTYHNEPELIYQSTILSLELTSALYKAGSETFTLKIEDILQAVIIRGFRFALGGKVAVIKVLLKVLGLLVQNARTVTIRYSKLLLEPVCEILHLYHGDDELQLLAADALCTLLEVCWPVLLYRRGMIFSAVVSCWSNCDVGIPNDRLIQAGVKSEVQENLQKKLRQVVQTLKDCYGDKIQVDIKFIVDTDPELYRLLLD
ncbi:hypothetical protein BJ742DRAFT_874692 [Cladochytrium replicatum]|nr:hypothetical protein BJ742DRAFT_874692 [Cladochytrium replicatum]